MGKINSRNKGARFERTVAEILREYGYEARRGQQYCGANGDPDVISDFPLQLECKAVERLDLYGAFTQAISDAKVTDKTPAVVHKKNHSEPLITMRFHDLLNLIKEKED
jgi:Holliday junction resolvase